MKYNAKGVLAVVVAATMMMSAAVYAQGRGKGGPKPAGQTPPADNGQMGDRGPKQGPGGDQGKGAFLPDSLIEITVSGTVLVDTAKVRHARFLLDSNGDMVAEYILEFGPEWYAPDSSDAKRPVAGDVVTIEGGVLQKSLAKTPVIIVFTINGLEWRDPVPVAGEDVRPPRPPKEPICLDSLETIEVTGVVIIDSTLETKTHFFLDENGDAVPDYQLMLGPADFIAEQGLLLPANGETITVKGLLMPALLYPRILVDSVNGVDWPHPAAPPAHPGGRGEGKNGPVPANFELKQNRPNPYNPTTSIAFSLNQDSDVSLRVFNMLGQQMASLVSGRLNAGSHNIQFNASNLPSGTYFYELRVDQQRQVKMMNLMK
jgi:hypothetical protein